MERIELVKHLSKYDNDAFRNVTDPTHEMYLHDTQINAARNIIYRLGSNVLRSNHVVLVAKMQSGKTGVCNAVVNVINKAKLNKPMGISKFLFITGMNDCGLKNQTLERVMKQIDGATPQNVSNGGRNASRFTKYHILKNSDLLHYDGNLDNTLIFIDESHYGSNERNILTQFLVKHNIDWKDKNDLISRNIYIVSVSATPFDEAVSDTVNCKNLVELETTDNYIGVSEYLSQDLIFDASKDDVQVDGQIFDFIMDAHSRMKENKENGIIIIRTRKFDIIENNKYVQRNFDVFEMYASGSKIEYMKLERLMGKIKASNELKKGKKCKPLIVLIKGAFRAGITINAEYKDLVYMVYDFSVKADTTAQALLGRMCGYRKPNATTDNTYFYINKKFAHMYAAWEQDFQACELIPCNNLKMEWMDNGYKGDDVEFGSKPCGNFSIKLSDDEIKDIYLSTKGKRNKVHHMGERFKTLLTEHGYNIKYDYIGEIQTSGKNNYAQSSQNKRFNSFSEDSLVFQFRPDKLKEFQRDTQRDYLTRDDLGKKCVSFVLDAEIYEEKKNKLRIGGNKRMLVYYVEVGQKARVYSRKGQYKPHKDTNIELTGCLIAKPLK